MDNDIGFVIFIRYKSVKYDYKKDCCIVQYTSSDEVIAIVSELGPGALLGKMVSPFILRPVYAGDMVYFSLSIWESQLHKQSSSTCRKA